MESGAYIPNLVQGRNTVTVEISSGISKKLLENVLKLRSSKRGIKSKPYEDSASSEK